MERKTQEEIDHEAWLAERRKRQDEMFGLDVSLDDSEYRRRLLGIYRPRGTAFEAGDDPEARDE